MGGLDLGATTEEDWVRMNLDTGAAVNVFPRSFAPEGCVGNGQWYKTASSERIEDYGAIVFTGEDEQGWMRSISGRISDVHKPLTSAVRMAVRGGMDFYLGQDGGYAVPRSSEIGWRMRAYFDKLLWKFGVSGLLPVYVENGVFNYYLKKKKVAVMEDAKVPVVAASDKVVNVPPVCPNGRQART